MPYERGYNLLYFIENTVMNDKVAFNGILRNYIYRYRYKAIDYIDFMTFLREQFDLIYDIETSDLKYNMIDWNDWLHGTELPKQVNDFSKIIK